MTALPAAFADLDDLAARWAVRTRRERQVLRARSDPADIRAFYDRMLERLPAVLDYLGEQPLADLAPPERRLLDLVLALAEVGPAVELRCGVPGVDHAAPHRLITPD